MEDYIHKVNSIIGKDLLSVILPKKILKILHIQKGDHVEITRSTEEIIIKKLRVKKKEKVGILRNDVTNNKPCEAEHKKKYTNN